MFMDEVTKDIIKEICFISKLQKPAEHCAEYSVTNNLHLY